MGKEKRLTPNNNTRKEMLDKHIAEMSVKSFFKTAFRHGYYVKIMYAMPRMSSSIIGIMNAMKLIRMDRTSTNIFFGCKDLGEIIENLGHHYLNDEVYRHAQSVPQDGPHQVMFCVNTMIRFLLEGPYSIPMDSINEIGSQSFNYACTQLFGEGFEDTTQSDNQGMQMNDLDGIIRMLRDNGMPSDAIREAISDIQRRAAENQANGRHYIDVPFFDHVQEDGHDYYTEWPF